MKIHRLTVISGLLAPILFLVGALFTAIPYRGLWGEAYSPLNHSVSELGEAGVSVWAPFFNGCLIGCNMCLISFTSGLALQMNGRVAWIFGALVGGFPMNHSGPHDAAARTFFFANLILLAIFSQHAHCSPRGRFGRWNALPGVFSLVCLVVYLTETSPLTFRQIGVRMTLSGHPDIWLAPVLEWLFFLSFLLWMGISACNLIFYEEPRETSPKD